MSNNDILYMKGMNMSESDGEEDVEEDIWDDRLLTKAYDKAVELANVEVARRIAMSTNSKHDGAQKTKQAQQASKKDDKKNKIVWKSGMPCRALYEDDGQEYEAFVLRIINDKEVVVRFLGYENSEIVPIQTLKPTLGKKERARQVEQAIQDKQDDDYDTGHRKTNDMDCFSERALSATSTERSNSRKKDSKKKKHSKQIKQENLRFEMPSMPGMPNMAFPTPNMSLPMPNMPFPMPNVDMFKNLGQSDLPLPPPPLSVPSAGVQTEDQAISSMLLSWYMSGYYTGLYQGMKRSKECHRN